MDSLQLNDLANKIRAAGGIPAKATHPSQAYIGNHQKPSLGRVHIAHKEGHINLEEAQDLNPKYDPNNNYRNTISAAQVREVERNPVGVKIKRAAAYKKKKGNI